MAVEAESVRAAASSRASDIWASVLSLLSRTFSYSASDVAARDSRAVAESDMESAAVFRFAFIWAHCSSVIVILIPGILAGVGMSLTAS